MAREDGQFKKGNTCGGRKKKPEWLNGKGEEALKKLWEIGTNEETKDSDRIACLIKIAEYDLGKPKQQVESTNVNINAEQTVSLEESLRIIRELTADG